MPFGNLLGSLAVLAVAAAIAAGLPALSARFDDTRPLSDRTPRAIGSTCGVTVVPPVGALEVTSVTSPKRNLLVMRVDGVSYRIRARRDSGTLDALADNLRREIRRRRGYQVSREVRSTTTQQRVPGRVGSYSAPNEDGLYAVYLHGSVVVEVLVTGREVTRRHTLEQIEASTASLRFSHPSWGLQ